MSPMTIGGPSAADRDEVVEVAADPAAHRRLVVDEPDVELGDPVRLGEQRVLQRVGDRRAAARTAARSPRPPPPAARGSRRAARPPARTRAEAVAAHERVDAADQRGGSRRARSTTSVRARGAASARAPSRLVRHDRVAAPREAGPVAAAAPAARQERPAASGERRAQTTRTWSGAALLEERDDDGARAEDALEVVVRRVRRSRRGRACSTSIAPTRPAPGRRRACASGCPASAGSSRRAPRSRRGW